MNRGNKRNETAKNMVQKRMWNVKHNRRVRKKYGQRIHTDLGGDESAGHHSPPISEERREDRGRCRCHCHA
jgi:hypothetical protein